MNEEQISGLSRLLQGFQQTPYFVLPSVWGFIGFTLLLCFVAWKSPKATQSPSFFSSAACLAGYFILAGAMVWFFSMRSKPAASTFGFLVMLQFISLAGALLFLIHSLVKANRSI